MEDYYNETTLEYQTARDKNNLHPDEYPGKTLVEKYLCNEDLRRQMLVPNIIRDSPVTVLPTFAGRIAGIGFLPATSGRPTAGSGCGIP